MSNLLSDFVGVDPVVRLNNRLILNSDGLAEVVVVLHDDHVVVVVLDELDVEQLERLNNCELYLSVPNVSVALLKLTSFVVLAYH